MDYIYVLVAITEKGRHIDQIKADKYRISPDGKLYILTAGDDVIITYHQWISVTSSHNIQNFMYKQS